MKRIPRSFVAAAVVVGLATLYTPRVEAFTWGSVFGRSKTKASVVKTAPANSSVTAIAVPLLPKNVTGADNIGTIDNLTVTREVSSSDLSKATLKIHSNGTTVQQFNISPSTVLTVHNDMVLGFDKDKDQFVIFKKDADGSFASSDPVPSRSSVQSGPVPSHPADINMSDPVPSIQQ